MIPNKKGNIILVLKVLEEYTDEDHYLTQPEIVDKIKSVYGVDVERKSVGSSLQILQDLDYEIFKGSKGGFALIGRTFDPSEASYLIDSVLSNRSLPASHAKDLSKEIVSCFSKYQREDYSYVLKSCEINRTTNKQVLYNVGVIHEAMKLGKRVEFELLTYDKFGKQISRMDGYRYVVSPYFLVNNFGRYYLICNYREKYSALQTFRIDYMLNIKISEEYDIKPLNSLQNAPVDFDIYKYMNDHLYMLGKETIDATLELDEETSILYIKDWFGESAKIRNVDGKIYADVRCNEDALYYWVLQYSEHIRVVEPDGFVNRIKEGLRKALERY